MDGAQISGQTAGLAGDRLSMLRDTLARIEGRTPSFRDRNPACPDDAQFSGEARLPLGAARFDALLGGGLPQEGLIEVRHDETREAGTASGFTLALAGLYQRDRQATGRRSLLWVAERQAAAEAGLPYAPGLGDHGLDTMRLLFSRPRRIEDALWVVEAALACGDFAAVTLEVRGNPAALGFTESRRLHLKAKASGLPLLLLRQGGEAQASAARLRFAVRPAHAAARRLSDGAALPGSLGNPVFAVTIEKNRAVPPQTLSLEWSAHDLRFHDHDDTIGTALANSTLPGTGQPHPVDRLPPSADGPDQPQSLGQVVAFRRAS
ncbi:ImuA family protein [Rhizobium sp. SG2393]|uniref:ImuA family protein n=1 Tax=Rhizobium sp. SG2393 TaxID=3276279 RepID=UPI00366CF475